jgi:hypothetical protein
MAHEQYGAQFTAALDKQSELLGAFVTANQKTHEMLLQNSDALKAHVTLLHTNSQQYANDLRADNAATSAKN